MTTPTPLEPGARIAHPATGCLVTVTKITWDRAGALVHYKARGAHWRRLGGVNPPLPNAWWTGSFALVPASPQTPCRDWEARVTA